MPETEKTYKIIHLSDLHFDAKKNEEAHRIVWKSLKDHLSKIEPDLILITGDIVDTPSEDNFIKAKDAIDSLGVQYCVCPGNHDRHKKGNALPFQRESILFEQYFGSDVYPTCKAPIKVTLGADNNKWIVRITGVDSSRKARYSAQGFINADELGNIRNYQEPYNSDNEPPHLLILILHHHLLPLMASETSTHSRSGFVKWLTTPTNPGTILENLAMKHFDLVLHGHEHHKNLALYGSYEKGAGQVAVLASGTATGMDTLNGPDLKRASFSVLELRADRSVWVKEVCGPGDKAVDWIEQPDSERLLLDNTMLRRHRFLREQFKSGNIEENKTRPLREYQKHITITKTRDAIIDEKKTHWDVSGNEFKTPIKNATGYACDANITIKKYNSGEEILNAAIKPKNNENRDLYCCADVGINGGTFEWIKTSYTWVDSIILTMNDFELINPNRGMLRCDGMEFVAATVEKPMGSLTLSVSFPAGFTPNPDNIMVYRQRAGKDTPEKDISLLSRIIYTGTVILLTVPYPFINNRYIIAWEPIDNHNEADSSSGLEFQKKLLSRDDDELAIACMRGFAKQPWADSATAAIYVPFRRDNVLHLKRVSYAYGSDVNNIEQPPRSIRLGDMRGIYLHAWWNQPAFATNKDSGRFGQLDHENVACTFPLKPLEEDDWSQPWAVVRVGISQQAKAPDIPVLRGALAEGNLMLLNKLREVR